VTEQPPGTGAVEAARALTGELSAFRGEVAALAVAVKRSRHYIFWLTVSLIVDVALTVVVAVFAVQAHDANTSAIAARAAAAVAAQDSKALCTSGNVARAEQIEPWEILIHLAKGPETSAQKHEIAVFTADLRRIYAPRNCSHITPGAP
jgi:hypothetical protein